LLFEASLGRPHVSDVLHAARQASILDVIVAADEVDVLSVGTALEGYR